MYIVIGGGAAGIFAAISAAEKNPQAKIIVLEKSMQLLAKVRISGGGRCNVTHACFDPKALVQNYPRGGKALLGPFFHFQPQDIITWFETRGVRLKTEGDGRIFPVSDSSLTIIDCLLTEAAKRGVEIRLKQSVEQVQYASGKFTLLLAAGEPVEGSKLLLATGSSKKGYEIASSLGHTIEEPVPSLFSFNTPSSPLLDLSGISVLQAGLRIQGSSFSTKGPLLLTHWGFSGPAALKLSAWSARHLHACQYQADLIVDWLPDFSVDGLYQKMLRSKEENPSQFLSSMQPFALPRSLWKRLAEIANMERRLAEISHKELLEFAHFLHASSFRISGKTTYKEEFVTCGGVKLQEVNGKTLESRICPGLYFAGEILDIDGITGGFNFQNAWTTAYLAASDMVLEAVLKF